jgi:hypothetical protein
MKVRAAYLAWTLAGCATFETGDNVWYKDGATFADQQAALAAAQTQAKQAHVQGPEERDIVIRSMAAQGWRMMPKQSAPTLKSNATRTPSAPQRSGTALP